MEVVDQERSAPKPLVNDILAQIPAPSNSIKPAGSPYWQTTAQTNRGKRASSGKLFKVLAISGVALGAIVTLGLLSFFIFKNRDRLLTADMRNTFEPSTGNWAGTTETAEALIREHKELQDRGVDLGLSIPENERQTSGATKLMELAPKFETIYQRSLKLKPVEWSVSQIKKSRIQFEDRVVDVATNTPRPTRWEFFRQKAGTNPNDKWQTAINDLASKIAEIETMIDLSIEPPDPLVVSNNSEGWSKDEQRVFAIHRLDDKLHRSFIRVLAPIARDQNWRPSSSDLATLHRSIDAAVAEAQVLANIPAEKKVRGFEFQLQTIYEEDLGNARTIIQGFSEKAKININGTGELDFLRRELVIVDGQLEMLASGNPEGIRKLANQTSLARYEQVKPQTSDGKLATAKSTQEIGNNGTSPGNSMTSNGPSIPTGRERLGGGARRTKVGLMKIRVSNVPQEQHEKITQLVKEKLNRYRVSFAVEQKEFVITVEDFYQPPHEIMSLLPMFGLFQADERNRIAYAYLNPGVW